MVIVTPKNAQFEDVSLIHANSIIGIKAQYEGKFLLFQHGKINGKRAMCSVLCFM